MNRRALLAALFATPLCGLRGTPVESCVDITLAHTATSIAGYGGWATTHQYAEYTRGLQVENLKPADLDYARAA